MLDPFINEIQWSSDKLSLQNVVELFQLPQLVKCQLSASTDSKRSSSRFNDGEILVLNGVRTSKVVRATDSLKNEYYIPLWTSTKVEVIWRKYKNFYDDIEELIEDFPAHIASEEDDDHLGIKKGDVLKLKAKIHARECSYLQCTFLENPDVELNIPLTYKRVFKTLGSLTQKQVLLRETVENCSLPLVVKFIDNKLKMKRADGSSRFPIALFNIDHVTLHEVINYTDVIASKLLPDATTGTIAISLDPRDFEVYIPVAKTRSCQDYQQFCNKFVHSANTEMARVGIEHNHWIVFQDQEKKAQKQTGNIDQTRSATLIPKLNLTHIHSATRNPSHDSSDGLLSGESKPLKRKDSHTFPRVFKPTTSDASTKEMHADIYVHTGREDTEKNTSLQLKSVGSYGNVGEEAKYVTMKANVLNSDMKSDLKQKLILNNVGLVPSKSSSKVDYENWGFYFGQGRATGPMQNSAPGRQNKEELKQRPKLPAPRPVSSSGTVEPPPLPPKPLRTKSANKKEMQYPPGKYM